MDSTLIHTIGSAGIEPQNPRSGVHAVIVLPKDALIEENRCAYFCFNFYIKCQPCTYATSIDEYNHMSLHHILIVAGRLQALWTQSLPKPFFHVVGIARNEPQTVKSRTQPFSMLSSNQRKQKQIFAALFIISNRSIVWGKQVQWKSLYRLLKSLCHIYITQHNQHPVEIFVVLFHAYSKTAGK